MLKRNTIKFGNFLYMPNYHHDLFVEFRPPQLMDHYEQANQVSMAPYASNPQQPNPTTPAPSIQPWYINIQFQYCKLHQGKKGLQIN
jgi:hypothetical protein